MQYENYYITVIYIQHQLLLTSKAGGDRKSGLHQVPERTPPKSHVLVFFFIGLLKLHTAIEAPGLITTSLYFELITVYSFI